jgi:hypothetical protein
MNNWYFTVHFAKLCFYKTLFDRAPFCILNEEAIDINTLNWRFLYGIRIVLIQDVERVMKEINRLVVLSCIGLEDACNKPMREEKFRKPEGLWMPIVCPLFHEFQTLFKIFHPAAQRLQKRVRIQLP